MNAPLVQNLIDGRLVPAESGRTLRNVEPATGGAFGTLPDSDEADVAAAVAAARRAFPQWSRTPAEERSRILLDVAARIEANAEALAELESRDTGKPIRTARTMDIPRAAKNMRFFATAILHTASEAHATDEAALNVTLRRPRGVAGCISPWNLPLYLFTWKIAPAVATGNTAVAKPSELTPATAHRFSELCVEAGLPPGVLNVVHGLGAKAGGAIVAHPDVTTLTFTGGTKTGATIASTAGPLFKKVSLELGGKNATIVCGDADFDTAVSESVRAAFTNQGQVCLCGSRVFVERGLYDRFTEAFVDRVTSLRLGDPMAEETDLGALVSEAHMEKVLGYIALAREEGGTILTGGSRWTPDASRCRDGYFVAPTVVTGLSATCRVNVEEIFGPLVTLIPFDSDREALDAANATPYGLSASVWTTNLDRAHAFAEGLDVGTVWVNCWLFRDLRVPFGGMKQSGVGREGGEEALRFFTEPKNVCFRRSER